MLEIAGIDLNRRVLLKISTKLITMQLLLTTTNGERTKFINNNVLAHDEKRSTRLKQHTNGVIYMRNIKKIHTYRTSNP